jgi:hypothetical protein
MEKVYGYYGYTFCSLLQGKLIMRELNESELCNVSGAGMWGSIGSAIGGMFGGGSAGCNGSYSHTSTTNKDGSHSESTSFSGGCSVNVGGKSGGSSKGNGGSKSGGGRQGNDHGRH